MRRFSFFLGLAIGYVLGSKAGRQRYEQIQRSWRQIRESPSVQEAAGLVQARAENVVGAVKSKIGSESSERMATTAYSDRVNGSPH